MSKVHFDSLQSKILASSSYSKYDFIFAESGVVSDLCFSKLIEACKAKGLTSSKLESDFVMTLFSSTDDVKAHTFDANDLKLLSIVKLYVLKLQSFFSEAEWGFVLFPYIGKMNHSCDPNCVWIYDKQLEMGMLFANKNIKCEEELTISYRPLIEYLQFSQRQHALQHLHHGLGFVCDCDRCVEESKVPTLPPRVYSLYKDLRPIIQNAKYTPSIWITTARIFFNKKQDSFVFENFCVLRIFLRRICALAKMKRSERFNCFQIMKNLHDELLMIQFLSKDVQHEILYFYAILACYNFKDEMSDLYMQSGGQVLMEWAIGFEKRARKLCRVYASNEAHLDLIKNLNAVVFLFEN